MGHHYYDLVVSWQGSTPPKKMEADAFLGYVMQKPGANLNESLAAMNAIATDQASSSHSAKRDRLPAITRVWNAAKAKLPDNTSGNTNLPPVDDPSWLSLNTNCTTKR